MKIVLKFKSIARDVLVTYLTNKYMNIVWKQIRRNKTSDCLTLIWVGFLGVCFEMEGGGSKTTHPPPPPTLSKTRVSCARSLKFGT